MQTEKILFWIDHAAFYIKTDEFTIFVDPFRVSDKIKERADIILITHPHFDHCSKSDIEKIRKSDSTIIAPAGCLDKENYEITRSRPGFTKSFGKLSIKAVHAYNTNPERLGFHKKSDEWVGYVIDYDGFKIYHPGDTDFVDEMTSLNVDVALLPIGGTYTMDVNEAVLATKHIKAIKFVPMHYRSLLGEKGSAEAEKKFKEQVSNAMIMKQMQKPNYSF